MKKKGKNWKFYINTVKNVSTASHKLPHFLSEHVFIVKIKHKKFGAAPLIFVGTGRKKESEFYHHPSVTGANQIYTEVTTWCSISKRTWTHFSPLSLTTSICFIGTTSREIYNFQKILTPSKITLLCIRLSRNF